MRSTCRGSLAMFFVLLLSLHSFGSSASSYAEVDPDDNVAALTAVSDESDITAFVQKVDVTRHLHYSDIDAAASAVIPAPAASAAHAAGGHGGGHGGIHKHFKASWPEDQSFKACISDCPSKTMLDRLRLLTVPDYSACNQPERVGEPHDGGYVGCGAQAYSGADAVLSFGISGIDKIGCDIAGMTGAQLLEYDCFVTKRPACGDKLHDKRTFKEVCLGSANLQEDVCIETPGKTTAAKSMLDDGCSEKKRVSYQTIDTILQEAGLSNSSNLVVKIDIEGGEWDAFKAFTDEHWGRISNLFLELHLDQRSFKDKSHRQIAEPYLEALEKINEHFVMTHFMANNCAGGYMFGDIPVPQWQEITFLSRRVVKQLHKKSEAPTSLYDILAKHRSHDATGCRKRPDLMETPPMKLHYYPQILDSAGPLLMSNAYYINLDRSAVRRQQMESELLHLRTASVGSGINFMFERFPALDGASPQVESQIELLSQASASLPQGLVTVSRLDWPGTIACYLSHLGAWKNAWEHAKKQTGHPEFALIMEDDVKFHVDGLKHLREKLANVPWDADIIVLGTFGATRPSDLVAPGVFRASGPFTGRWNIPEEREAMIKARHSSDKKTARHSSIFYGGMHAYLIRLARVPHLINYFENKPPHYLPDAGTVWNSEHMRKYVLSPGLVLQYTGKSERAQGPFA